MGIFDFIFKKANTEESSVQKPEIEIAAKQSTANTKSNLKWPSAKIVRANPNHKSYTLIQDYMGQLPVISEELILHALTDAGPQHWASRAKTCEGSLNVIRDFAVSIISEHEGKHTVESVKCELKKPDGIWPNLNHINMLMFVKKNGQLVGVPLKIFQVLPDVFCCLYFNP